MLGAIIGDVAGSYYEVLEINHHKENHKPRSYQERIKIMDANAPLFGENSSVTDDSILTCAIADAIMSNASYEDKLREYGLREINLGNDIYGRSRFGAGFVSWLNSNQQGNSYGNGCAMRISPIGFLFDDITKIKEESYKSTMPSHNHIDSIKCSEAIAISIHLLKNGISKEELKAFLEDNYFSLTFNLEALRHTYTFTSKAINSVPQAIFCFLESNSFEDAIRTSISIGGDSDTIAAITGSLAEAYYGIPKDIIDNIKPYLKEYMIPVIDKFYERGKTKKYAKNN
ncbi:MAG: ADP-ribosylglycohydrolase [Bacilli bacterium]|nr:ADP-ribosylglycohydrolase [Bacilli bacterium]